MKEYPVVQYNGGGWDTKDIGYTMEQAERTYNALRKANPSQLYGIMIKGPKGGYMIRRSDKE